MMDSPLKSGSKEKEKSSSSSSSGGDHHCPFSSLHSLITQTCGVQKSFSHKIVWPLASLQPAASIQPKEHTRKPQIAMGGKKERKTIKDPTALVRRRNDTLFAQVVVKSARAKEIQARANSDLTGGYCAPLRLFRQLLFQPKEEDWRNVILAAKSCCIGGQQNKSSHIANVRWATPPHFHVIIARLRTCVSSRTPSFLKKPFCRSPQMQWTLESNKPGLAIAVSLTNYLQ
ncbi:myosin heavy chain [Trypanosoma cruzi Dm28c]|uniref:Myosin heavy chain n=1 Tax=Trypanosoma cruzi Dm28c TaxID=1416333 RepID=V5AIG0_TRYCR|nr:myosin heavy chain [Trypanosoma cruzi Dm28c]